MTEAFKRRMLETGTELAREGNIAHVKEFGRCVGTVEELVDYNKPGEKDPVKVGPEINVRWLPTKLRYCYHPDDLELV